MGTHTGKMAQAGKGACNEGTCDLIRKPLGIVVALVLLPSAVHVNLDAIIVVVVHAVLYFVYNAR